MDRLRISRTITANAASVFGALVMVGAVAFGASVLRPMAAERANDNATAAQQGGGGNGSQAGHGGEGGDFEQPNLPGDEGMGGTDDYSGVDGADDGDTPYHESEPTDEPEPEPEATPKPDPVDEPDPTDKPDATDEPSDEPSDGIQLEAFVGEEGKIVVKWLPFEGDFEKYKIVRSTDSDPSWPTGEGDELIAAIGRDDLTRFTDGSAPCGVELHYRVFAVRHGEEGYVVVAASNADGVYRECPEPPADPSPMGFEVFVADNGIKLHWEACTDDAFVAYKVVRSATNESPMFPLHDGDELLAAIGDKNQTWFLDENVEPGQTFTYRVLSLGEGPDGWVVLGLTEPITVTFE